MYNLNMKFKRTILKQVINITKDYPITLVTGARQVGKTTLVEYFKQHRKYNFISFDDDLLVEEAKRSPREFLNKYKPPLIIDEVQKVQELFGEIVYRVNTVRREQNPDKANGMYILTGSQKYALMRHAAESMAGRVGIIEMPPLSQAEINNWTEEPFDTDFGKMSNKANDRNLSDKDLFKSIIKGFYPERWRSSGKTQNYFRSYIETYIEKDVLTLVKIKDKQKFEKFLCYLASLTAQEYVVDNITKTFGIDIDTLKSWISILITGDIIRLVQPYYESSMTKSIVKRQRIYFNDTGLVCSLLGIDDLKLFNDSIYKGRIIETYIHNEIRKSFLNNDIDIDRNTYYYRDNNQNEIDLVILHNGGLYLIECKSTKKPGLNAISNFKLFMKSRYTIKGQCVICLTDKPIQIGAGIFAFPIKCI